MTQHVYWVPPSSVTNGHFWVLKRLLQDRKGLWYCAQCGILFESKSVLGFRVAIPHNGDLKGLEKESCESIVVRIVHGL